MSGEPGAKQETLGHDPELRDRAAQAAYEAWTPYCTDRDEVWREVVDAVAQVLTPDLPAPDIAGDQSMRDTQPPPVAGDPTSKKRPMSDGPPPLDPDEVHLLTLALPMPLDLAADLFNAIDRTCRKNKLKNPVVLTDGSNRVVARRTTTEEGAQTDGAS